MNLVLTEFSQCHLLKTYCLSFCRNIGGELLLAWIWMGKSKQRLQFSAFKSWLQRMQVFINAICLPIAIATDKMSLLQWHWPWKSNDLNSNFISITGFTCFFGKSSFRHRHGNLFTCYYAWLERLSPFTLVKHRRLKRTPLVGRGGDMLSCFSSVLKCVIVALLASFPFKNGKNVHCSHVCHYFLIFLFIYIGIKNTSPICQIRCICQIYIVFGK